MFQHPLGIASNAINLKRLIWLRFIILASELAAAFYAIYGLHFSLALKPLFVLFSVAIVINLLTLKRLQQPWPVTDKELFFHFSLDVLLLTVLLYFTGGSTNPFAPLYLIPLTLTAATLPGFYTWCMVLVTVSCYSLLFFMFEPLPDIHGSHDQGFRLHVFGMWLGFLLSAVLISSFGV
ncbi:MAG: sensor histidine kinase, partial [Gammaproteobacteria bacterium]|nr:sensor histidine kinase [Gammaproteobacteria bacterium]